MIIDNIGVRCALNRSPHARMTCIRILISTPQRLPCFPLLNKSLCLNILLPEIDMAIFDSESTDIPIAIERYIVDTILVVRWRDMRIGHHTKEGPVQLFWDLAVNNEVSYFSFKTTRLVKALQPRDVRKWYCHGFLSIAT